MVNEIENVVSQFERGAISRRQMVGALLMMAAPGAAAAQAPKAVTPGVSLNHVHLYIPDLDKAIKFYSDVFGATIRDTSPNNATLSMPGKPGGWISLTKYTEGKAYINHVGYGVDFDQKGGDSVRVANAINKMYPEAKARPTGPTIHGRNTRSVYLYDPNGIYLQIVPKEDDGWLPTGPAGSKILKGEKP